MRFQPHSMQTSLISALSPPFESHLSTKVRSFSRFHQLISSTDFTVGWIQELTFFGSIHPKVASMIVAQKCGQRRFFLQRHFFGGSHCGDQPYMNAKRDQHQSANHWEMDMVGKSVTALHPPRREESSPREEGVFKSWINSGLPKRSGFHVRKNAICPSSITGFGRLRPGKKKSCQCHQNYGGKTKATWSHRGTRCEVCPRAFFCLVEIIDDFKLSLRNWQRFDELFSGRCGHLNFFSVPCVRLSWKVSHKIITVTTKQITRVFGPTGDSQPWASQTTAKVDTLSLEISHFSIITKSLSKKH